jgi:TPR repeat protein
MYRTNSASHAGDAKACRTLTQRYLSSIPVPLDRVSAGQPMTRTFRLADSACAAGDPGGCAMAGVAYGLGQGAPPDVARGRGLEERACAGGDPERCYIVGYASCSACSTSSAIRRTREEALDARARARTPSGVRVSLSGESGARRC